MTREETNRRLCELLKVCPHDEGVICEDDEWFCEVCGEPCDADDTARDFFDPAGRIDLLRRMTMRDDNEEFIESLWPDSRKECDMARIAIPCWMLFEETEIPNAALEFLEERK